MNFNSKILKVSIVIALVLMLIPIAAAEDASDVVYSQDQSIDEVSVIETQDDISEDVLTQEDSDIISVDADDEKIAESGEEGEYSPEYEPFVSVPLDDEIEDASADLEIVSFVTPGKLKVGDTAIFTFMVYNNGPDTARNVVAYANILKGDVLYISSICDKGVYDSYTGVWAIGDLESGDYAMLLVLGKVLSDEEIVTLTYVTSDTPDPDESNNFYIDIIPVEKSANAYSAESVKLPATGNPVLMVLLALLTIIGVTVRKRD